MLRTRKEIDADYGYRRSRFKTVIMVLVLLWLASFFIGKLFSAEVGEKVAVIPIEGVITGSSSGLPFGGDTVDSKDITELIKNAGESKNVKAVILEINSPGGTVLASKQIADAVKNIDKPVIALIEEIGTSGAYWVASASDHIIADEMSLTGSIGVNGGYLEFSGLMDEYGVGYEALKGGKYKDIGNPYEELNAEKRKILQSKIDIIYEVFVNEVANNREMDVNEVKKFSDGLYYLGVEAMDFGLIDEFGGMKEAKKKAEELSGFDSLEEMKYETKSSLFDIISVLSNGAYYVGRGVGDSLTDVKIDQKYLTPMA
ncbi:MAG: signal peptide peptidase SppA [Nanoarchaeota archaeon]|nr:signal peptide peptidase SppA [Nanoarchaeota archaeon]